MVVAVVAVVVVVAEAGGDIKNGVIFGRLRTLNLIHSRGQRRGYAGGQPRLP